VQVAHNAIAVTIDAARLPDLAKMPGVVRVRPVIHYEMHLSETAHVGGAAVQAGGTDGTGVRIAVSTRASTTRTRTSVGLGCGRLCRGDRQPRRHPGRPFPHGQGGRWL
jgi:hypothetical protein